MNSETLEPAKGGPSPFTPARLVEPLATTRRALPRSSSRRLFVLGTDLADRGWQLCEKLLAASLATREEDPEESAGFAEVALQIAHRLDESCYGACQIADLKGKAAIELADALRSLGRIRQALRVMRQGVAYVDHGTGSPVIEARLFELSALVFAARGRERLSVELLERAWRLYLATDEERAAGRALLRLSKVVDRREDPRRFLELLLRSLELMDPLYDRDAAWRAIQDLVATVVELGWVELATELLAEIRAFAGPPEADVDAAELADLERRIVEAQRQPLKRRPTTMAMRSRIRTWRHAGPPRFGGLTRMPRSKRRDRYARTP
ncbi:MAG: hypothetical protein U0002_05275 [Thermoanaerobaculia bacterium]